ncbi:hypothetical protein QYF36_012411 [Acer negundo]|nr:hypothetical protein QYF36_012411 [Acer negundo]
MRLRVECRLGKSPKYEVKNWLENIQMIIHDAENIESTIGKGKYFSRARLAKLVDKKIQELKEYHQKSSSFHSLVIDAPPASGIILPTTKLAGETTAKKDMDEIWGYLMGNEIKKIGVCGMGGAGKTTIMTHVNNKLLKETKFDNVIWVTLSQTMDLLKLQKEIAVALKENFQETEDVKRRAGMLSEMLRRRRFTLILDDVWENISLEELGIPEPTEENGCKLVITTRSLDVCRVMGCKPVQVKLLSEKEALELFFEKAELNISKVPTLSEIVELMAKQCASLPLAIVAVASSMKGEEDIHEWRNALHELFNDVRKGLVDEIGNLQAIEHRARIIINRLVNNYLLLESIDNEGISCVKLHDVVRDMTLKYITNKSTNKSPRFMVKAGMKLEEFPSGKEWKENLDKISLMNNYVREIPSSSSPNCQILSTLFLQGNPLESIPESFFSHMHGLKILNLSGTEIENLPNSISECTNLTALLLQKCRRLKRVPSLARLGALQKLDLGVTKINEVPAGMEMLANLTSLDLLFTGLHMIPGGILPKLCRLQKLRVQWGLETLTVAVEEAVRLKNLDCLVMQFWKLQDFNRYVKSSHSHRRPNDYCLIINRGVNPYLLDDVNRRLQYNVKKVVILIRCYICGTEDDSIFLPKEVECLFIRDCSGDVRNISSIPTFNTLERLEILHVEDVDNLTGIFSNVSAGQYSHLKVVKVIKCPKLKKLLSSKLLSELKNLEQIDVGQCKEMEELIAVDDDDDNEERSQFLPKLKRLSLIDLPKLKSIASCNRVMVCDSLQEIVIWGCPQLKHLPIYFPIDEKGKSSPPPALNKITVERKWWEALEWDHLHSDAKRLLLPLCVFDNYSSRSFPLMNIR